MEIQKKNYVVQLKCEHVFDLHSNQGIPKVKLMVECHIRINEK